MLDQQDRTREYIKLAATRMPHLGGPYSGFCRLRKGLAAHGIALRWLGAGSGAAPIMQDPAWAHEHSTGEVVAPALADDDDASAARMVVEHLEREQYDGVLVSVLCGRLLTNLTRYLPKKFLRLLVVHSTSVGTYKVASTIRDYVPVTICVSTRIRQDLIARYGFDERRTFVIANAVDLELYQDIEPRSDRCQGLKVIFLGRLEEESKGILWLPKVFAALGDLDVTLTIAGDGRDRTRLQEACAAMGSRVTFLGPVQPGDVPRVLAQHDVLLMPSRYEGFGHSLIEGMAAGCVPVASHLRGVTDTIVCPEEDGFLFPVGDTKAAADVIRRLARDRTMLERVSAAARRTARNRFSIESMASAVRGPHQAGARGAGNHGKAIAPRSLALSGRAQAWPAHLPANAGEGDPQALARAVGDMRIIVAQLGGRMHYAVPRIFYEAGMLGRLYTDTYIGNKPLLELALGLIPAPLGPGGARRLLGRKEERIPPAKITSFDAFGLQYARAQRRARGSLELTRIYADFARTFCERVVTCRPEADAVWAFNGAALELFRWAKMRGKRCLLEQTLAPRKVACRLLAEESERWPGWEPSMPPPAGSDPLAEREEEEWGLADRIVAGSAFVTDGIRQCGGPADKCAVVPYGVDPKRFSSAASNVEQRSARRLRVLFAGEVGLRKGAPYLLEALRQLGPKNVEGRFAGRIALAPERLAAYRDLASFLGSVPRLQMPALYCWADVLVLPSVCEGSATVVYEALAASVYVIATPNAGSVLSGTSAFGEIVPIRDIDAIANALLRRRDLGSDAKREDHDTPRVSLRDYRGRLLRVVEEAL